MIVALIWNFNLRVRYHQIVDQKLQKLNIYGKIVWINFSQKSLQNQNFKRWKTCTRNIIIQPRNETMPPKKQNIYERHSKFCLLSLLLKMIYILLNNLKRKKNCIFDNNFLRNLSTYSNRKDVYSKLTVFA
jgi:hypothetical protein